MQKRTRFIVLRGPSASGKSTVAAKILQTSTNKIATVELDLIRHNILHDQEDARDLSAEMCKDLILKALDAGYDVITDGIANMIHYRQMFDEIIQLHPSDNYMYYFDISLEETLKRHQTRPKKGDYNEDDLRGWYKSASPSGYGFEQRINETMSLEQITQKILAETGI